MNNIVVNHSKIIRICNRLTYQIIENSHNDEFILIAGIKEKGFKIANIIVEKLTKISTKKIELRYIDLDKSNPKNYIKSDLDHFKVSKKIFLIDDVLNTGKTLMYAVNKLLDYNFDSIKTVVLIDRNHKKFPVKVDFKGISLSTNFDDTVKLNFSKDKLEAIII
jgi:pyrimidine operon attenuation protein/uracil phosphoribosyltransferase